MAATGIVSMAGDCADGAAERASRPWHRGGVEWLTVLGMVGAGVTFVLFVMATINTSTTEKLGAVMRAIDEMDKRMDIRFEEMDRRHNNQLVAMGGRLDRQEAHAGRTDERLTKVEVRLERIDFKLERMDARLDGMDSRLDGIDSRLGGVDSRLDGMGAHLKEVDAKLKGMDAKLDRVLEHLPRRK